VLVDAEEESMTITAVPTHDPVRAEPD
jgi:hypothetical protein